MPPPLFYLRSHVPIAIAVLKFCPPHRRPRVSWFPLSSSFLVKRPNNFNTERYFASSFPLPPNWHNVLSLSFRILTMRSVAADPLRFSSRPHHRCPLLLWTHGHTFTLSLFNPRAPIPPPSRFEPDAGIRNFDVCVSLSSQPAYRAPPKSDGDTLVENRYHSPPRTASRRLKPSPSPQIVEKSLSCFG